MAAAPGTKRGPRRAQAAAAAPSPTAGPRRAEPGRGTRGAAGEAWGRRRCSEAAGAGGGGGGSRPPGTCRGKKPGPGPIRRPGEELRGRAGEAGGGSRR